MAGLSLLKLARPVQLRMVHCKPQWRRTLRFSSAVPLVSRLKFNRGRGDRCVRVIGLAVRHLPARSGRSTHRPRRTAVQEPESQASPGYTRGTHASHL